MNAQREQDEAPLGRRPVREPRMTVFERLQWLVEHPEVTEVIVTVGEADEILAAVDAHGAGGNPPGPPPSDTRAEMTPAEIEYALEIGPPDFLAWDNAARCAHSWIENLFTQAPVHVRVCEWCGLGECRDSEKEPWRFFTQLQGDSLRARP